MQRAPLLTHSPNKPVTLYYCGNGSVSFEIPLTTPTLTKNPRFSFQYRSEPDNSTLKKKKFYEIFFNEGIKAWHTISIDAWDQKTITKKDKRHPAFRTVMQIDGDIVFKVHQKVVANKDFHTSLQTYESIRNQVIVELFKEMYQWQKKILRAIGSSVLLTYIVYLLYEYGFM